jgi:hypothetical protein
VIRCRDVVLAGSPERDGNEAASGISVETVPIEALSSLVASGEICAASSVASIYQALPKN